MQRVESTLLAVVQGPSFTAIKHSAGTQDVWPCFFFQHHNNVINVYPLHQQTCITIISSATSVGLPLTQQNRRDKNVSSCLSQLFVGTDVFLALGLRYLKCQPLFFYSQ